MLHKIRTFFETPLFALLVFAVGVYGAVSGQIFPVLQILAILIGLLLFVCDDIMPTTLPFMVLIAIGAMLAKDFSVLLAYWPWAMPAAAGIVFHFTVYRKPFRPGKSFRGCLAVTAAVTLGGLGSISAQDYFSPTSLVYVTALGAGLVMMYYLYATEYKAEKNYDVMENLLFSMLLTGIVCSLCIVIPLLGNLHLLNDPNTRVQFFIAISYRNSMTNYLIMLLPAPFYFAGRHGMPRAGRVLSFLAGLFMYGALVISMARTALLFGTVEFVLCLIYYLKGKKDRAIKTVNLLITAGIFTFLGVRFSGTVWEMWQARLVTGQTVVFDPTRYQLICRAFSDFLGNPLFGSGLGSTANADICTIPPGCLCWYHSYFPQIFGSMGLLGLAAYGYQLFLRAKLMLYRPDRRTVALSLSYIALFLYSQTDPGSFEPVPFEMLSILIFVLLERNTEGSGTFAADDKKAVFPSSAG